MCFFRSPVFNRSSDSLRFHVPPSEAKGTLNVCAVTKDDRCHGNSIITYTSQPSCTGIQPNVTWTSGGRKIHVQGNNLDFVESIIVHSSNKKIEKDNNTNSTDMWFLMHPYDGSDLIKLKLKVGNVTLDCANLTQQPDPEFIGFEAIWVSDSLTVNIKKKPDNLNLSRDEVNVTGLKGEKEHECALTMVKPDAIVCVIKGNLSTVDSLNIRVGNFSETVYMSDDHTKYLYILVALILLIILGAFVGVFVYRKNQNQMHEKMNKELENMEMNIRRDIRQGFVDLQTEKSDLIENVGAIPFLDFKHFASKIFFPEAGSLAGLMIKDIGQESEQTTVDEKCQAFATLIRNKQFLTCFVHALEEQKDFNIKDKCTVASLLTLALHGDLMYLTEIMEDLLQSLMDQSSNANPKLLLRRTESIVEKLLTNWMSICLYSFLKEVAGEPLYKLYRAIKYQVDKGPVDAVTGKAKRTLNDSHLFREDIDYCSLTLTVLVKSGLEVQPCPVKVLDTDTITQVKDKILDQIYKGIPYSQRPAADSLDLEWRSGQAGHLTLSDDDVTAIVHGRWKRINTLQHYKVPDGATVALIPRSQSSFGVNQIYQTGEKTPMLEGEEEEGLRLWHLVKPSEDPEIPKHRKSSMRERERAKAIPEIYLTRLLSMKGTLQKFVDDVFVAILSTKRPPPIAVRFFFDFLDDMAEKHGIDDPETVHIWKTNSLPLRFWVNILKNPQFVFDVQVTDSVDAVLSVIAQTFIDSCTTSEHKVGRDSPVNKLLYAREIPRYKQLVERYYSDIHNAVSGCYQEMNSTLTELSGSFASEMNSLVALHELYKYINKYYDQVIMSLEEDAAGQKMQLAYRLQQVAALVENKVTDL